nr:MarR family transcriptional regulator [uncultured Albidiferax sp.]
MTELHVPHSMKLLGRVTRGFYRLADVELRPFGLASGQLPVLVSLKNGQALSQAELARIAQVEQPSMAQLLNRMERDGLVERVADPQDKRSRLISLTSAAAERLPQAKRLMEGLTSQALAGFTPEEIAQLGAYLARMNDNIDRMAGEASTETEGTPHGD